MAEASRTGFLQFLVTPPYRFDMAVRRGGSSFLANSAGARAILDERVRWLAEAPNRCAACVPEAEVALQETVEAAVEANPTLAQASGLASGSGSLMDRCLALGRLWEPDFLLLLPSGNDFRLVGGCVCFPSAWAPEEKFGRPLEWIHAVVPGLKEDLGRKIQSFLDALKPGVDWERVNWGIAATDQLNLHPERGLPRMGSQPSPATSWFRLERQAFRRLPRSNAVLFLLRIEVIPLTEACREPGFAPRLRELLGTMSAEVAQYKGLLSSRRGLIRELTRMMESQKPN